MSKLKIAMLGLGNAGTLHAITLLNHPDIEIVGICDTGQKKNYDLLSKLYDLKEIPFYQNDDDILSKQNFDGVVISADPISYYQTFGVGQHPKMVIMNKYPAVPVLWERPFGQSTKHIDTGLKIQRDTKYSVISYDRFTAINNFKNSFDKKQNKLGELVGINGFISISIPQRSEIPWRYKLDEIKLPSHILDHYIDMLSFLGLPNISSSTAKFTIDKKASFETAWAILVELENGSIGTLTIRQYKFNNSEYLHKNNDLQLFFENGFVKIQLDKVEVTMNDGKTFEYNCPKLFDTKEFNNTVKILNNFLIDEEKYTDNLQTTSEAIGNISAVYDWVESLKNKKYKSILGQLEDCRTANRITSMIVKKAK